MLFIAANLWLLLCAVPAVWAQFQFFDQMFGHGQQQHQQQRPSGNAAQWASQADSVSCAQYLCPDTLVCVSKPSHCPCPDVQDIKCLVPDTEDRDAATIVCVRGLDECAEVETLAKRYVKR